ncbi:MAG: class I SAM-dependent DNA methyltransferase [Actinobacteria bacterium]|nr:class I SAM-dependent DNA methyltransferase [Actinomycetota bacterium]
MALSGDEIRRRLREFAAAWGGYAGTERAEAQTFLNDLLACYGANRRAEGARFEERAGGGFMDLYWPGVCIVEMKRPSEAGRLRDHREQMLGYWQRSGSPASPAPRYVVLCAFHRFEVWEPGAVYTEPRVAFDLVELPDHLDALLFLAGRQPVFVHDQTDVTREAVSLVTDMYARLRERRAADLDVLRDFVLQSVWAMFAEDLSMLPSHLFTRVLDGLISDSTRSSRDDLGQLYAYLNEPRDRPTEGIYAGTPYANGSLFARPARVHLEREELELLRESCGRSWRKVEPAIFGALLQGALGRERQWALGAHYTAEADILKIVLPTIVEPWRERVAACRTLADVQSAQDDLMRYVVLDPACGSGNFLYVAYRELRRIEAELRRRAGDMRRNAGLRDQGSLALYFPLTNIRGIELDPFAVQLARVTLWMGHKLAVDELDLEERVLPLVDLSGIRRGDALKLDWPRADAIIGNPPYHGSQMLRRELGNDYVEWLRTEFEIGVKDYAVYWFRKTHERLAPGGRAGLVATNSISQNRNRGPSLQWIIDHEGVITSAVSKQPWKGDAVVNVSIVNWTKAEFSQPARLDGSEVEAISASLTARSGGHRAARLRGNGSRSFQGVTPCGEGFVLTDDQTSRLLEMDEIYDDVVRPYLLGEDLADDPAQAPRRSIVDFGLLELEEAMRYPAALELVRFQVKPERDRTGREPNHTYWWRFERPRPAMRKALEGRKRFIAANRYGKRFLTAWEPTTLCPSGQIIAFSLDDDSAMGVLTSSIHAEWAWEQSSTIRVDLRYTPTSAFETFPWPSSRGVEIEELAVGLHLRRSEICVERQIGLTKLYNEVDDGAYADLRDLHVALDEAVAAAYGWPASVAHDPAESNRRLLELNRAIAAGELDYRPFD